MIDKCQKLFLAILFN